MTELRLRHLEVAIPISGVAQTLTKAPLLGNLGIIVVSAVHRTHLLALLEVVVGERVDLLWIGIWHLAREVLLASYQLSQGITTIVAWQKDVDNALSQRFDVGNETRTTFIQYQNDRLTGLGEFLHEITLVL